MNKRFLLSMIITIGLTLFLAVVALEPADLLAGPGWTPDGDGFYGIDMVQWLLLFMPVYCLELWNCESVLNRSYLYVHRYQKIWRWWLTVYGRLVFETVVLYLLMGACMRLLVWHHWTGQMTASLFLIAVHALFCLAFCIWMRLVSGNMIFASMLMMLLEVMAKIIVVARVTVPAYSVFSWGMYYYSVQNYGTGGFRPAPAMIIQFCVVFSLVILVCGRGKALLLRRISDGKVR